MAYRILIAPDKFKGSLNAFEACAVIEKGLLAAAPILLYETAFQISSLFLEKVYSHYRL